MKLSNVLLRCREVQTPLFARPMPLVEFTRLPGFRTQAGALA
jgi:hypothetical protein